MATTFTWTNLGASNWNNTANWSDATVPNDPTVSAEITNGGTADVDSGIFISVDTLTIGTASGPGTASAVGIDNNSVLRVSGDIVNFSTLALDGTNNLTELRIGGGDTVTLNGGGTISLAGSGNNMIRDADASTGELINVDNTIVGAGFIGSGQMAMDNQAAGIIDADSPAGLTLQPNAAGFTNEGLMEATAGGGMGLNSGTFTQTGGTLLATGTGWYIVLYDGVTVSGGTFVTNKGGSIYTQSGSSAILSNVTITAGSTYNGLNNTTTYLEGTIDNLGTLAFNSTGNNTELRIAGGQTLTLTGGGEVNLTDQALNYILDADLSTGVLINVDNTIEGAGNIGNGQLSWDNQSAGTIDANSAFGLTLDPNSAGATNEGLIEATAGGVMGLDGQTITQTGTMLATGAGSSIQLYNNVNVSGGTLITNKGGTILTQSGYTATLSNLTIAAGSTYTALNNTSTYLNGTIINDGTVTLQGTTNNTELRVEGAQTLTLKGGGIINLAGNGTNYILDADQSTGVLVNVDNTIEGTGNIGNGQLSIDNRSSGIIDANSALGLTLQSNNAGMTNEGLIEATAGGAMGLNGVQLIQTGGTLLASGANSSLGLDNNASVTGGVLDVTGGASIFTAQNQSATLNNVTILAGSTYLGENNSTTFLSGTIDNAGTLELEATTNQTNLRIADGTTLTGGGKIALSDNGNNLVWGIANNGSETVTNVNNTIQGSGTLGYSNSFEFLNQAGGVIDATGTASGLTIFVDTTGALAGPNGGGFVNQGLLEATEVGGLGINNGQLKNLGGTILASGAGNDVYLENQTTISGGLVESTGGAVVQAASGQTGTLDGATDGAITLAGTILNANNSTLFLEGVVDNTGQLQSDATVNSTNLRFADGTTLTGGGTITLSDNINNLVWSATNTGTETVTNFNNTIQGSGLIGYSNSFEFINQKNGVVDATGTAAGLTIDIDTQPTVTVPNGGGLVNLGLLEATGTGGLGVSNGQVDNLGGTILADGAGNDVYLENQATISGGLLEGTGGGVVQVVTGQAADLDGASQGAITLGGTFLANNNTQTFLDGTINNTGQFQLEGSNNSSNLRFAGGTTLTGGGTLTLSDNANNLVFGIANTGTETVTNVNNTIQGSGTLGYSNSFEFTNEKNGLIDATGTLAALTVQAVAATAGGFVNQGLMEATNTAGLVLNGGQFNNQGGTILATGTGVGVYLQNSVTISGGTLGGAGGGFVQTQNAQNVYLDGGSSQGVITLTGTFIASNNSQTFLDGTIDNTGQFDFNAGASNTELRFTDGTTLTGDGTVTLSGSPNTFIFGTNNSGTEVLTNANNTIQGSGVVGYSNSFDIVNDGTFSSTGGNALSINPSTSIGSLVADIVNQGSGVIQGTGTGGVVITDGSFDNLGTFQALDDSSATLDTDVTNESASNGTLTAGTWAAYVTVAGDTALVQATGGTIDTDAADIVMSGSGASVTFWDGTSYDDIQNSLTSITATGQLNVLAGANFTAASATQAIANAGLVRLGGGTFTDATFGNSGTFSGFGELTSTGGALTNTGQVTATGGDLILAQGVTGTTGDITIGAGASLDVSGATGGNTVNTLLQDGAGLALGTQNITVSTDYDNASFGIGNSFDKIANVTGTGGILAAGTVAQVLTGNVSAGTGTTPLMAFGNIHVGSTASLSYAIANTGSAGPELRGAIQTTAGGGSLSDDRLTGAGVTASDFGPIVQGATTSSMNVTFSGLSAGSLIAQGVHIANNFANVAEQTLTFTGAAYRYADPSDAAPNPVAFGDAHVGDAVTQALTLTNTDPNDGFSEALDASIGSATGSISVAGSFTGLTAQSTNNSGLSVTLNTGTVGIKSGSAVISLISDGTNIDGLGTTDLSPQTIAATGTVFRLAAASAATPNPIDFGNVHVDAAVSQDLALTNTAAADGFSEALDANIGSATGSISAAGSFISLGAQLTNSGSLAVTLNTTSDGDKSGSAVITLTSDGAGIDTLGTTAIGTQTVTATGTVYAFAAASTAVPNPINFGDVHVNDVAAQGLTLRNTAAADGFAEALDASIGSATGAISAAGSFTALAAQATNSGSLAVTLNTGTAGDQSGSAVISLISDGNNIDGLGTTAIGTQVVNAIGTVFNLATASAVVPNPVNFGDVHVHAAASEALTLTNIALADGFSEALDASIGTATGSISAAGSFTGLGAQITNSDSLAVTLNTATDGDKSGTAVVTLTSDGTGIDTLGTTAIGTQTITATGTVFALAAASAATPDPINFGNVHVNAAASQDLALTNTAAADGFSEALDASIGSATGSISAAGSFTGLGAQITNSDSLAVTLNTASDGDKSGTAVITLTSDGLGIDTLGTTAIGTQTVAATGTVYAFAAASTAVPNPIDFGDVHVNDVVAQGLTVTNTAAADGFAEALDASIGSAAGAISANGSFTALAAQATNGGSLAVTLNTGTVGDQSGSAVISLISDGNNIDGLGTTAIGTQTVTATGTVFALAAASAITPNPIDFGNFHVGSNASQNLIVTNTAAAGGFSEALDASIGSATGAVSAAGSFTGLAAQATDPAGLTVAVNTASDGDKSGTAVVTLTSDGTNIDTLGTTAIGTQTVSATATVYAFAAPDLSATILNFGATRVGDAALTQATTITNGTSADPFQESLAYTAGSPSGDFSVAGDGAGTILSGGDAAPDLSLSTGTAGDFTGSTVTVGLTSLAGGIGLTDTTLTPETLTLNGKVYATAVAQLSTDTLNFGVVHVGDADLSQAVTITNAVTGALTDALTGAFGSLTGPFSSTTTLGALAASQAGSLSVALNTATSGVFDISAPLALLSHDSDQADAAVNAGPITVTATIDNFATAALGEASGAGTFAPDGSNYVLNFGTVAEDKGTLTANLDVANAATGLADLLAGDFGGITGSGFDLSGFGSFSGLGAGQTGDASTVSLDTSTEGQFSETVTLTATGGNSSGYTGAPMVETLTISGVVACFARGTRLATQDGEVAVESLSVGDELRTMLGGSGRIVWIGTRTVDCERHPRPETVWPVRVAAGALGSGRPRRELWLSPDHAVYTNDVLIPVKYLINGTTIQQVAVAEITYYHVELPAHDVVLAEGLPAESYLDVSDRSNFENAAGTIRLFPDFATHAPNVLAVWETHGCARLLVTGRELTAIRQQLSVASAPGFFPVSDTSSRGGIIHLHDDAIALACDGSR